ncbi:hypothetical protein GCM10027047_01250 [Rhodococcus aerolatus]
MRDPDATQQQDDLSRPAAVRPPTAYERMILAGLQARQVYGGTVDPVTVAERRARNRVARASRRINRRRSK